MPAAAGIDGVLLTDVSVEEAADPVKELRAQGLDTVFLAAPTSSDRRLRLVARLFSGFIYLVSRTGVTGESRLAVHGSRSADRTMRGLTELPLALGFGISTPEQVEEAARIADGVVVGSAIVRAIEAHAGSPALAEKLEQFTRELDGAATRIMSHYTAEDLTRCRVRIDEIDLRLLELLNQRTAIVEEIGRIKEEMRMAIYEPKREEQVFANVLEHNAGPLPPDAVKRIFERIIDEMRTVQKMKMKRARAKRPVRLRNYMLVVMQEGATEAQTEAVISRLVEMGFTVHRSTGVGIRAWRRRAGR